MNPLYWNKIRGTNVCYLVHPRVTDRETVTKPMVSVGIRLAYIDRISGRGQVALVSRNWRAFCSKPSNYKILQECGNGVVI